MKIAKEFAHPVVCKDCRMTGDIAMLDNLFTPTHLVIILVIALLVFGPRKLPELGKGLGEGIKGFKEGIKGVSDTPQQENIAKSEAPPQPPAPTQVK
jgi:sec-independent protein translocase protein TatA